MIHTVGTASWFYFPITCLVTRIADSSTKMSEGPNRFSYFLKAAWQLFVLPSQNMKKCNTVKFIKIESSPKITQSQKKIFQLRTECREIRTNKRREQKKERIREEINKTASKRLIKETRKAQPRISNETFDEKQT
jgi:hypothetical protein